MNCVDAVCLDCGQPFVWLPGTPRVCPKCRAKGNGTQPKVKVKTCK